MKQLLKSLYKANLIEQIETYDFFNYYYFLDEHHQIFGILKEKINQNEKRLIETNYTLIDESYILEDHYQILEFLLGGVKKQLDISQVKYYFIRVYTYLDDDLEGELINLLKASFSNEVLINRKQDIYIIITTEAEDSDFYNLLQSIESDFLIKLIGFESDCYPVDDTLPMLFQFDLTNIANQKYSDDFVITKANLVLNRIIGTLKEDDKKVIKTYILKHYLDDFEMLKIIRVYFETNFNTSLAAKICYMHRNTFINKLDKFTQETNFNLRNYDDALIVYLALNL